METKAERKARLLRVAGDAIERAIATGADPFDLMLAATGAGPNICIPYVQLHPSFVAKRALFKTKEDRRRDRDLAALAAEPGPVVWVRRQFDDHRHAAYRLAEVSEWHKSRYSGGIGNKANRRYLHGYVWCDAMIAGRLAHSCQHGPPPHRIKVCVTKKGNEKFWKEIEEVAANDIRNAGQSRLGGESAS
ncbi:MAG TPA: hypothetical protein VNR39_12810 [Pseudolabrys sp.]|nr:hypothetical protein [Pseudolabrys sp.]